MKLDNDLVRDLLILIEEKCDFNHCIHSSQFEIPEKTNEDIVYTLLKLSEAGFINCTKMFGDNCVAIVVSSLTWDGHQFLDNIRDDEVWKLTKQTASKLTSTSISILSTIASNILTKMITGNPL